MIEESWTNSIGQVIHPGDRVVVITEGYSHRIVTRFGKFVGVTNSKLPRIIVQDNRFGWYVNGKDVGYSKGRDLCVPGSYEIVDVTVIPRAGRVYALLLRD